MSTKYQQAVPIDECRHELHRFDDACDVIEVVSPGGRPVTGPGGSTSNFSGLISGMEVTLAFVLGVLAGTGIGM
jgi:hypothetical protein